MPTKRRRLKYKTLDLRRVCELYADVCNELDQADSEKDEYCLLLSNCADDLDTFISGMERLREAGR